MKKQALKGNIIYSETPDKLAIYENAYVLYDEDGLCQGVTKELPRDEEVEVSDYGTALIIPGLFDIHAHAPQYAFRGLGMDKELLDWLDTYTFPEESRYGDMSYAKEAYDIFVDDLVHVGTTRVCLFATVHTESVLYLMDKLEEAGICGYVGKVSMNRNCCDELKEEDAEGAIRDWLNACDGRYKRVQPILTPRFIPSCSDDLMRAIAQIQKETGMPLQSHLSENISECEWVKELVPESTSYADAYDRFGTFGQYGTTVMAHGVHCSKEERALMAKRGVVLAHSPESNINLTSGVAPVKRYLEEGVRVGLATDMAGGANLSMLRAMAYAIEGSKMRTRLLDEDATITLEQAFYIATKGGGSIFGKVGSFESGYEMDAVVLKDDWIRSPMDVTTRDRLERLIYLGDNRAVVASYANGRKLFS